MKYIPTGTILGLEAFTCQLYEKKSYDSVNEVRIFIKDNHKLINYAFILFQVWYQLFCSRSAQASQLPPSNDALKQHILRANYQAAVWRRALIVQSDILNPHNHGWIHMQTNNGLRLHHWMEKLLAPRAVEMVSCNCKTGCTSPRCSCRSFALIFVAACRI